MKRLASSNSQGGGVGDAACRAESAPSRAENAPSRAESAPSPEGAADEIDVRVAAMLPAQLLQPSEIIILLIKPSLWFIVLSSLGFLAAVAVITAGLLSMQTRGYVPWISRQDLYLVAFGVTGIRLFWQFLDWLSRLYVLTDQRIIRVGGVVRVQVFETPLKNVQHTQAYFSLRERLFNLGTIAFATSGTAGMEAGWHMVANPLEVHRIVVETLNRYGR